MEQEIGKEIKIISFKNNLNISVFKNNEEEFNQQHQQQQQQKSHQQHLSTSFDHCRFVTCNVAEENAKDDQNLETKCFVYRH